MIVTTEAIVLKSMKYGDTSNILTMYTKDFGKISLIAKGARGPKSKFGAALEPLSHSQIVFYRKETRDLQFLSQADLLAQFRNVTGDASRLMIGFALIEYVHAAIHGEEQHEQLFQALLEALRDLDASERNPLNLLVRFLLDLSAILGFAIDVETCLSCRQSLLAETAVEGPVRFQTGDGGFLCGACSRHAAGFALEGRAFKSVQWIDRAERHRLGTLAMDEGSGRAILRMLHHHISVHIPDMRTIRSLALMDAIS